MDFGEVGLDGLVSYDSGFASDPQTKQKWCGSGFLKQQRSGTGVAQHDEWRDLKVAKTSDDFSASKAMLRSNSYLLSDGGQQMLSFSSPNSQAMALPYYHHTSSSYGRNTGYGSGASVHGVLTGGRGAFTPSQWMELEHQALIYKYITANAPVPSNLLIPIRKALESAGFSSFPGGHLRPNTLGWGAFHLGFSNTDPEPGRCRRTDGKKWRCSRDAVPDQKYCERHMNRGRHRSRKPVEGQSGNSVSGPTAATAKLIPISSSTSAAGAGGGGTSNSSHHHQLNNLHPGAPPSTSPNLNRSLLNKANADENIQDRTGLSMLCPISVPKPQNLYEEPSQTEFGLVCSDSLLNPLHRSSSSLMSHSNYVSSEELNPESKSQNSLRQFMDDWPKNQSEHTVISWPDIDKTQLSISIPMASSDFMSSTSSPTNDKIILSPLRLSCEPMGLGVGAVLNEPNQKQANWIPISWETSVGGPLGEVLHSTNNSGGDCNNTSALNLMTEGWESSPRMASSPTGVLQKTTFRSLSNSSAGSSPRTENNKTNEGASLCNNLLGATMISSSLPAL